VTKLTAGQGQAPWPDQEATNFAYSREGLDETNVSDYVIASEIPVSAAQLENDGIFPTGSASAGAPFNFPNTDVTATFQPGVPESTIVHGGDIGAPGKIKMRTFRGGSSTSKTL
jgi:hypothetical protein